MLACVCQPAETKLYKGGRATPIGPLGGPRRPLQRPRSLKSRPPKPPPKPNSYSTTSEDTKSSSSQQKSPKNLLSLKKIEQRSKSTKISSVCSSSKSDSDSQSIKQPLDNPFKPGDQEKLLKINVKPEKIEEPPPCNNVVTITDNDGKIYCVDNLILVGEDILGNIKNDYDDGVDDVSKKCPSYPSKGGLLTVKQKTDKDVEGSSSDGTNNYQLPEGVELTLGELRAMALRQQQQIDCQHQLLAAREQRLRFLKQQEARHHQVAAENERLRRLRERVEAQELKLRRLRALRGQLDQTNLNNVALTSDLESIRALFNEKEKELSVAVAKVEELTRQLEEVRRGRAPPRGQPPAALELDKLRRELMYRNKLNEQQNARLSQQREALTARQAEMASIDQRISELQGRLQRKRVANRQLAAQISGKHHTPRSTSAAPVQLSNYPNAPNGPNKNQPTRGNIAAIEPYNHIPHAPSVNHAHNFQALKHNALQNNLQMKLLNQTDNINNHLSQQEVHYLQQKQFANQAYNGVYPQRLQTNLAPNDAQFSQYPNKQGDMGAYQSQQNQMPQTNDQKILLDHINKYNIDLQKTVNHNHNQNINSGSSTNTQNQQTKQRSNEQEFLPEFAASKSDPKYQTLPYNTKFAVNGTSKPKGQFYEDSNKPANEQSGIVKVPSSSNVNNMMTTVSGSNLNHMTAHSTPLTINKGLATPLTQSETNNSVYPNNDQNTYNLQKSDSSTKCDIQEEKENIGHVNINGNNNVRSNLNLNSEQNKVNSNVQYKNQGNSAGGRADLVRGFTQQNAISSSGQMKPVSSVAPTSVQVASGKPSPIYQTSSTKIQPVQPQTVSHSVLNNNNNPLYPKSSQNVVNNGHQMPIQNSSSQSLLLSPPQSSSTPMSTPDVTGDKLVPKPALPPKPSSKGQGETTSYHTQQIESSKPTELTEQAQEMENINQNTQSISTSSTENQQMIIKARPLTIRKQPLSEQPKLRNQTSIGNKNGVNIATTRRIEMPPAYLFPEIDQSINDNNQTDSKANSVNKLHHSGSNSSPSSSDTTERGTFSNESSETSSEDQPDKSGINNITDQINSVDLNNVNDGCGVTRRIKKGNLKQSGKVNLSRRVSFDPLALLLDASLEGELELVQKTATQVANASAANDEGITALHNAICAGHFEIVKFLVEFGCDVNAQDSDGWTPLHCAASCNNVTMVRFLVENGACIFATTLSDHETAAQKCEEDEEGFDGCSEYLYSVQEKLGIMNGGTVFAVFPYKAHENDELSFNAGTRLSVVRKGDDAEREWWWARAPTGQEGYVPRNLLGLYPRVTPKSEQ